MSKKLLNLLLLMSTFALYLLVIKPVYTGQGGIIQPKQSVQSLRTLNAQYDNTLLQAEGIVRDANELRGQYQNITPKQKADMLVMVPDGVDKVRLLSEVYNMGQEAGFALNDLSYGEGGSFTGKNVGAVSISFTVKTTYPRFKELMANFERSMRLYSIDSVSFTFNGKEDELATYQVKLKTYYLK